MIRSHASFSTIESAQEFLALLSETIDEALDDVRQELSACTDRPPRRQTEAWQLVFYTTTRLATHVAASRRLLNDLRTLRNLMRRHNLGPWAEQSGVTEQTADV
jgi:hypothetical protein